MSVAIYLIMALVFCSGIYFLLKLRSAKSNFKKASKKILEEGGRDSLSAYLSQEDATDGNPFSNKILRNTFEEYRSAVIHQSKIESASPYIDITVFFHSDLLDIISHGSICELIPGAMTGLGLLGTFLGLKFGISGLDIGSTDGLMNGISNLLAGMNTAFGTSIWGVGLSLIFSFLYKSRYNTALSELNHFVDVFQSANLDCSDNSPENLILGYQHQQTEAMKTFADEVALSISNCMVEILAPVTAKMESTIDEFAKVATTQQKEGLEQIVKEFIRSMNDALGGQFEALGNTIQELCEWQKTSVEQMQTIVDGICETSKEIDRIHELSQQTISETSQYIERVNELQATILEESESVRKQVEIANEINERNSAYIQKIVECEERISQLADSVKQEAEAASKAVDILQERCEEQIKALSETAQNEMAILSESTKVLAEAGHQQIQALSLSAQDEMRLLSETSAQLAEENKNQLEALAKASSEQMDVLSKACVSIVESSQQQIASTVAAAEAQTETMMQTTNDFVEFVQQQNQIFTDAVKQEVEGITNQATQTTAGLDRAAASVETAAQLLDKNLETALSRTFTEFDTGLSEITQHLSGTIADVRDTTESVPHLIVDAQKRCEDTLKALAEQTEKYTASMKKITEEVQKMLNSVEGGSK